MFWERVLLAFLVSASSFCFSYYWYRTGGPQVSASEKSKEVAKLVSIRNEVQRKPSKRVIWEPISRDEILYLNEAIKTGPDAEAVIEFTEDGKVGTKIHLEPDSVVVLEETGSDLTLDFLQGNVFVAGSGGEGLKIKSGESTIAVGKGELNLNKTADGGVDLQVLKGSASVEADGKSIQLGENQVGSMTNGQLNTAKVDLKILSPISNRRIFVDLEKKEKVLVRWAGLPEGFKVKVFAGEDRNRLEPMEDVEIDYEKGELRAPFKVGRVYWRLEAKSDQEEEIKSSVVKNKVVSLLPPKILQPENGDFVVLEREEPTYMFQFANPLDAQDLALQVWPAGQNPTKENTKVVRVDGNSFLYTFPDKGAFNAVLTGRLDNGEGQSFTVSSKVIGFNVQLGQKLIPPKLVSPQPEQTLAFQEYVDKGVFLNWQPVPTIKKYQVRLEKMEDGKRRVMTKEVSDTAYLIKKIEPGEFTWSVSSIDKGGTPSEWSEKRTFSIGNIPELKWADGKAEGKSYFAGVDPYITLEWVAEGYENEVVKWRSKIAPEGKFEDTKKLFVMKSSPYQRKVESEGFYQAQVQGVGKSGKVIAQTSIRRIQVMERPLLPAPRFAESIPEQLKATARGNLALKWSQVDGAAEYLVELKDNEDKVIENFKAQNAATTLKSLKPGKYKINVFALDVDGRRGIAGEYRPVTVENKSDVRAPAFKKVKIKAFGGK